VFCCSASARPRQLTPPGFLPGKTPASTADVGLFGTVLVIRDDFFEDFSEFLRIVAEA